MEYIEFEEAEVFYQTHNLIYGEEVYEIIGFRMEIHRIIGKGFSEIVYKDAMEYEFKLKGKNYSREKKFEIPYKETILSHSYNADFIYENKIILEVKAQQGVIQDHFKQTINYLAASKLKLGLIINFGEDSLKFKRVIF
ncbi:MAG: GxxExxY protein [Bacteroidota bacterium]